MGAGIAQVSIDKGYKVMLKDAKQAGLSRGSEQVSKGLQTAVKKRKFSRYTFDNINIF